MIPLKFSDHYLDIQNKPAQLTQKELEYFHDTVSKIQAILGISVEITNRDHDELGKPHKEALGLFYTSDPSHPADDCYITVDNYFIHECYDAKFNGKWTLEEQSLEEVICHELAHMSKFRHCKSHKALTQEYLAKVESFNVRQSLDSTIAYAAERQSAGSRTNTTVPNKDISR